MYQVVRDNLQTLYAAVEDGFAAPLPAFVRDEFERYLDCGILIRGSSRSKAPRVPESARITALDVIRSRIVMEIP